MKIQFTFLILLVATFCNAQIPFKEVFDKIKNATPVDTSSEAWKKTMKGSDKKSLCISGNCKDGFGIQIYNAGGYTPYQYEGNFINGGPLRGGTLNGAPVFGGVFTYIGGGNINKEITYGNFTMKYINGAYKFYYNTGAGLSFSDIQYLHVISSENLYPCNCLVPTRNRVSYRTVTDSRVSKIDGGLLGTDYQTTYSQREVAEYSDGLVNTSKFPVIIRGFRRDGSNNWYYDLTQVVMPGESAHRIGYTPTNFTIPNDSRGYMAQYTTDPNLVKLCEEQWKLRDTRPVDMGNGVYKITAYTDEPIKLPIKSGSKIKITATGLITYEKSQVQFGPEGLGVGSSNWGIISQAEDGKPAPMGALLAKRDDCAWVVVGKGYEWTTECDANYLTLMINHKDPSDKSGYFLVKVTVTSEK